MAFMRTAVQIGAAMATIWLALYPTALWAEEALLQDGKRVSGTLAFSATGRVQFTPKGKSDPLAWNTIQRIEFDLDPPNPTPQVGLRRVILPGDQWLTGEFLGWDKEGLRFRPFAMDARVLSPAVVRGVRHMPGMVPILEEDFADDFSSWKLEGKPGLAESDKTRRKRGLNLVAAGQSATYRVDKALPSGKVGVDFALEERAAKGRWVIALEFRGERGPTTVDFGIHGDGVRYQTEVRPTNEDKQSRTCKAGSHRVLVEWGKSKAILFLDNTVLWKNEANSSFGSFVTVRFACSEAEETKAMPFVVESVLVAHGVSDTASPLPASDQDVVLLPSGDQLFGSIVTGNRRTIELEARGRQQKLSWGDVVGFCPRPDTFPPRTIEGEWVRLWLRTGTDGVWDELEGVVAKLDEKRMLIRHPILGELPIERARLHRIRRLFYGQRIELDNGSHHLGDKDRSVAGLLPPRAEGQSVAKTFRLEAVPSTARLLVSVVHLKGTGDGIGSALDRGELRTEVWVNNERIDYLNRLVERAQPRPQRLSVTIPKKLLRVGENVVELRQTPEAGTGHIESCGVAEWMIETER